MRRALVHAVAVLATLALPGWALAGTLTLHPSGFGEKSYAAWKAKQGLPDRAGNDNQSLYFQKFVPTGVVAAGVAIVKGFTNVPVTQMDGLHFWRRLDGHCGAGAPRWNVRFQPAAGGPRQTLLIGCAGMAVTDTATYCPPGVNPATNPQGCQWERRSFPGPGAFGFNTGTGALESVFPAGTVTSLAIVFDEGTEGRCQGEPAATTGESCVYLDNIEILTSHPEFADKCWTGAQDNSNRATGPCPSVPTMPAAETSLLSTGLALEQPTAEELLDIAPEVDPLAWIFYPTVLD